MAAGSRFSGPFHFTITFRSQGLHSHGETDDQSPLNSTFFLYPFLSSQPLLIYFIFWGPAAKFDKSQWLFSESSLPPFLWSTFYDPLTAAVITILVHVIDFPLKKKPSNIFDHSSRSEGNFCSAPPPKTLNAESPPTCKWRLALFFLSLPTYIGCCL